MEVCVRTELGFRILRTCWGRTCTRKILFLYRYKGYEKMSNGKGGCGVGNGRVPSLVVRFYTELAMCLLLLLLLLLLFGGGLRNDFSN